jgi:NAD(P)-dependent dehydrogenase (short-subunit alcohol dehydrogenase family)
VDILVNDAGVVAGKRLFHMTPIDEMRRTFEVNFFGTMLVTQYVSRHMASRKAGSIVNIASVAGLDGDPAELDYVASKAAVIGATKKLAIELGAHGVRVNAVAPGLRTPTWRGCWPAGDDRADRHEAPRAAGGDRRGDALPRELPLLVRHGAGAPRRRRYER